MSAACLPGDDSSPGISLLRFGDMLVICFAQALAGMWLGIA